MIRESGLLGVFWLGFFFGVSCRGIYERLWAWVSVTEEEDTEKAIVVQVYYRVLFDHWSFLPLVEVLGKVGRGFSMALGTQVVFASLQ